MAACAALALAGCTAEDGRYAERAPGPAERAVTVVRDDVTYPLTVEITDWKVGPHPQVPARGDAVHFTYRTTKTGHLPTVVAQVAVCAVDSADVVLLCDNISVHDESPGGSRVEDGDSWIGPSPGLKPGLSGTARVLLVPDQLLLGPHAGDPKDDDGYVPPRIPGPGERLRTG